MRCFMAHTQSADWPNVLNLERRHLQQHSNSARCWLESAIFKTFSCNFCSYSSFQSYINIWHEKTLKCNNRQLNMFYKKFSLFLTQNTIPISNKTRSLLILLCDACMLIPQYHQRHPVMFLSLQAPHSPCQSKLMQFLRYHNFFLHLHILCPGQI